MKIKVFRGTPKKIDLVSDNVKIDFSVIRDETAPLHPVNNGENVPCRSYIRYHYINQLQLAQGVAMRIKNLFREIETSKEPVKTSHYVRSSNLLGYESGM